MKRIIEAVGTIFRREKLEADAPPAKKGGRFSMLSWILEPEQLPPPAVSVPPARVPLWRWLIEPEPLPTAGTEASEHRVQSLLGTLIASETLPLDPEPPKREGRRARKGRTGDGDRSYGKKR